MHDTASFVLHLHFFFGITAFEKCIDLREHIEGDRMRINLRPRWLAFGSGTHLLFQLGNRASAAAGDSLITCSEYAFNGENAMQRIDRHQCDCGSAIWLGDASSLELR